jgi:hypothetical protein
VTRATAAADIFTGCTDTETADGDNSVGSGSTDATDGESTDTPSATQEAVETAACENDSTPGDSPDPDCSWLTDNTVPYDSSDTLFVFSVGCIGSWEVTDSVTGSGGRTQDTTSPIVTVAAKRENAGTQVIQSTDALSASEVDDGISSGIEGQYARFQVVGEQEVDGETVRAVDTVRKSLQANPDTTIEEA